MPRTGSRAKGAPLNSTLLEGPQTNFPALQDVNPKRGRKRQGAEAWYPYYAGYTEAFVKECLARCRLPLGATVLDPWNGSGTTTRVAHQVGFRSIGIDLNPVAAMVAAAKVASYRDAKHVGGLANDLLSHAISNTMPVAAEPLTGWFRPRVAGFIRAVQCSIIRTLATDNSGRAINPLRESLPPLAAFLTLCLARALRKCAANTQSSNPTWHIPRVSQRSIGDISTAMVSEVQYLSQELLDRDSQAARILVADARTLPLESDTCDVVITSPPYCTRIDYAVTTSLELALLGLDTASLDALRRDLTGTPLTRGGVNATPILPETSNTAQLLASIKKHPSNDSRSYYHKTYSQYVYDTSLSIAEIGRVLRPGGLAVLVVQNSFYKEIEVDLPAIICELGQQHGLRAIVAASHPVRQVMSTMNTRSRAYRHERTYREDVVALSKPIS